MPCNIIISNTIVRVFIILEIWVHPTLESSEFSTSSCFNVLLISNYSSFKVTSEIMSNCVFIIILRLFLVQSIKLGSFSRLWEGKSGCANFLIFHFYFISYNMIRTHFIIMRNCAESCIVIEFPYVFIHLILVW